LIVIAAEELRLREKAELARRDCLLRATFCQVLFYALSLTVYSSHVQHGVANATDSLQPGTRRAAIAGRVTIFVWRIEA